MPLRFTFREGPLTFNNAGRADPQSIGEALTRIQNENGGRLNAEDVVEKARPRSSPLHRHFEWDDKIAADAYRLDQARELIRIIRIVEDDKPPQRAFVSVHDTGGTSYRSITEILNSTSLQLAVLQAAEKELAAFERRYSELAEICELVREARSRISRSIEDRRRPSA